MRNVEWTKVVDGIEFTAHAREVRSGVFEVADDLLMGLMEMNGWSVVAERAECES